MRQNRQHLERKAVFNIAQIDDGVFQIVENEHEEKPHRQRQKHPGAEDEHRIGQDGLRGNVGGTADTDDFIVGFSLHAGFVLIKNKPLKNAGRNPVFSFELTEPRFGENDALLHRSELVAQIVLLGSQIGKLVTNDLQG